MPANMPKIKEDSRSVNINDKTKEQDKALMKSFEAVMSELNIGSPDDFNKQLSIQWNKAVIEKELTSVLLCEIDFYHEYVQNYGIQGASFMLISTALTLKNECAKHNCFLSRNDNCGFSILLKGGVVEEVQEIANSLCASVKKSQTEHKYSSIADIITLSVGITSLYPTCKTSLKKKAKNSLKIAKSTGGNQIHSIKSSQFIKPDEFSLEEEITPPPSNTIDTKRRQLVIEKQSLNSIKTDLFAEKESNSREQKTKSDRSYRGQVLKKNNQNIIKDAPTLHNNALNECNDINIVDKQQSKVRVYRGQIITK